jgi:hypothetical protein
VPAGQEAFEEFKPQIAGFADGIGKYWNTQSEVVLELENLTTQEVLFYGDYSSSRDRPRTDGRVSTQEELVEFDALSAEAGIAPGPWWLTADGTRKVLIRMQPHIVHLRKRAHRD